MNNRQFTIYNRIGVSLFIVYCLLFVGAPPALAADPAPTPYTLLAPIPLKGCTGESGVECQTTTADFLPGLFKLIIAIATGLAVIMLIYAGVKYISTDAFGGKEEAKGIIEGALWGLLLAMSAWLILNTINPNLVNLSLNIDRLPTTVNTNQGTGGAGAGGGSGLSAEEARNQFEAENIGVADDIILTGLRQGVIDEVIRLHNECGCNVTVTSATGGSHASGEFSHAAGYKVDLRSRNDGEALTSFITTNYQEVAPQRNGDRVFQAPNGIRYTWETNRPANAGSQWAPHWDVAVSGG